MATELFWTHLNMTNSLNKLDNHREEKQVTLLAEFGGWSGGPMAMAMAIQTQGDTIYLEFVNF